MADNSESKALGGSSRQRRRTRIPRFAVRRGSLAVASQALSSLSNLAFGVSIARSTSPTEYGAWGIGFSVYAIALHLTRATASTPLMLSGQADEVADECAIRGSMGSALGLGIAMGAPLIVVGAILRLNFPTLGLMLILFGIGLPSLLLNDLLRYVFFRNDRPGGAVFMDATWLSLQIGAVVILELGGSMTLTTGTISWIAASAIGIAAGACLLRITPTVAATIAFVRNNRSTSGRLIVDSLLTAGSTYLVPIVVAGISGLAAAGALRAGQTLMGGVNIIIMGLTPVLTLEARRRLARGSSAMGIMLRWSLFLAAFSAIYGIGMVVLPDRIGKSLLGESWQGASVLLLPLALQVVVRGPFTAGPVILKSLGRLNSLILLRVNTSIPAVLCPAAGAVGWGAEGAAWGLLAGWLLNGALSTWFVHRCRPEALRSTPVGLDAVTDRSH